MVKPKQNISDILYHYTHSLWREYHLPTVTSLISKILILGVISFVFLLFSSAPRSSLNILHLWNVWDAPHYLSIAENGYQRDGDAANLIVFLPLFPILIYIIKWTFQQNFLISAYLVSFFATIILAIMLYKLALIDYSNKVAIWTVIFLFIFPTSFFLHIPYTESLFISLAVSAFYFVRKRHYWISFLFISLASLTRLSGLALIPAIFSEIMMFDRSNFNKLSIYRKIYLLSFGLIVCLSGFFIYLMINYSIFGNPLQFTVAEKQNWYTHFSPFGQGLKSALENLSWRVGLEKVMLGYGQIIAFCFGLFVSLYVLLKIRLSYGIYMLCVLWLVSSMSFWLSMPRYALSLFPAFIALALFSQNRWFKYIWILTSVILLTALSLIFIQYGPVF